MSDSAGQGAPDASLARPVIANDHGDQALNVAGVLLVESARLERLQATSGVEGDYLDRLVGVLKLERPAMSRGPGALGRAWLRAATLAKVLRSVARLARLLHLLPAFTRQLFLLRSALRDGPEAWHLAVCIASNRLQLFRDDLPFRQELAALTRPLGGGDSPFAAAIDGAGYLLVFDAMPVSRLWQDFGRTRPDRTVLLDGAFLAFFLGVQLLTSTALLDVLRALRTGMGKEVRDTTSLSATRAGLYTLIACSLWQALSSRALKEGIFLTSNSTLPELLRACLIQRRDCTRVSELMHGVGSLRAEAIFASAVELGRPYGADKKLAFVPQIPGLPLDGVFRNSFFDRSVAINCYLNQYFLRQRGQDPEAAIMDEFERLRAEAAVPKDAVVITMFGNSPNTDRGLDSPSFRAEAALIGLIGSLSGSIGKQHMIVYVPHPALGQAPSTHAEFVSNRVQVHRDSVFCWLVSDLCVALNSSAMFEAAWFGARGLTPMIAQDRFYTEAYLEKVFHPSASSDEELERVACMFLDSWSEGRIQDVAERIRVRLGAMIGGCRRG